MEYVRRIVLLLVVSVVPLATLARGHVSILCMYVSRTRVPLVSPERSRSPVPSRRSSVVGRRHGTRRLARTTEDDGRDGDRRRRGGDVVRRSRQAGARRFESTRRDVVRDGTGGSRMGLRLRLRFDFDVVGRRRRTTDGLTRERTIRAV